MDLCFVDWNNVFQYCFHIEDCWSVFTDLLTQSVNKHVPVVHIHKSKVKQSIRHCPNYIRKLFKEKAIAWKRWKITKLEYDKNIYKTAAAKCSSAVNKYHAAKELELIRKNSVGSFYNYVNKKLRSPPDIRQPDGSLCTGDSDKCTVFNIFLAVYLLEMTAPPLNCALESIPHSSTWTQ